MSKTIKRALSLFLCAALLFGALPLSIWAEDNPTSGTCGDNLTWAYDANTATLTISGTGAMYNYDYDSYNYPYVTNAPWKAYYQTMQTVVISDGVTNIGKYAFYWCTGLTSVTIGNSVTSIGDYAFYWCTGLTSVTIGNSVTSIGGGAFWSCTGLTSVTIPDSVTSIGRAAFFNCTGLTSVTIPDSVTSIGYGAFGDCTGLMSVTIGNSVTSIGDYAFSDCTGLTSVTIPDSVTSIGGSAFADCTGLTSVTIGNSVTSIGVYAFCRCTGLTSVTIPASVTSIDYYAFEECTGLTAITVDANNPNYSSDDFGVLYSKDQTGLIQYPVGNSRTSFTIPDSVTSIGIGAFEDCTSLTSVTIPNSVTSIDDFAFEDCTSLTSVTIPDSVTSIDFGAFYGCTGLTSVIIPDSVTSIGESAFDSCTSLTSVTIPASVTSIGDYAFYWCTGLTSVTIGNSVTSIGDDAFTDCSDDLTIFGYPGSRVQTYANDNGILFIPIDNTPYVMLHCPLETSTASFEAYGVANRYQTVSVYDGETLLGTAKVDGNGHWRSSFTLNTPVDQSSHTITAKVTVGEKTVTDSKTLVYDTNAVYPLEFTLTHSGKTIDCLNARVFNLSVLPSKPMTFRVKLNRSVTNLWVTSTKGSEIKKIKANYDSASDTWSAESWFDPDNHSYAPGTLGIEVNDGKALQFESARIDFLIDPSGYAYEAVKSNRVEGATATILNKQSGAAVPWDANRYEQDNPQITDSFGVYHWDVTEGDWRVRITKAGYETAYSDWLTVPPEWTEVAIPIVCKAAPTVESLEKDGDSYKLTFDRYMDLTTVNNTNVQFANNGSSVGCTVTPLDKEVSGTDSSVYYAKTFSLKPAEAVTDVSINNAKSYAGTVMAAAYTEHFAESDVLQSIAVASKPAKTAYTVGEAFDPTGLKVNATYSVSGTKEITGYTLSTPDMSTAGTKTVTVTFEGKTATFTITVNNPTPTQGKVRSVSVGDVSINYKSSTTLKPTVTADEGVAYTVKYESSNTKVATVDANGKVTGAKKGTATITCTVTDQYGNTVKDTCKVTVKYTVWQWIIIILLFGWIWY